MPGAAPECLPGMPPAEPPSAFGGPEIAEELRSRPVLERVVHLEGPRTYSRYWDDEYSPETLRRCVPGAAGDRTLLGLQGRNLAPWGSGESDRVVELAWLHQQWTFPVEQADDREIRVRFPNAVYRGIFDRSRNPGQVEFRLKRGDRVLGGYRVSLCDTRYELVVRARFENCLDTTRRRLTLSRAGITLEGLDAFVTEPPEIETEGTDQVVTWRFLIPEGRRGRLVMNSEGVNWCEGGRWETSVRNVGPALHGNSRIEVDLVHHSDPIELRINRSLQRLLAGLLNLQVRLHNYTGYPWVEENASWVRVGSGSWAREYRFTIPKFYKELGGIIDPVIPDLISFVNDVNSNGYRLTFHSEGDRMGLELEIEFESEGIEIRNFAHTGLSDPLYADAHVDRLRIRVTGLYLGLDPARNVPAVLGTPRAHVSLEFDLRGLGEILEALKDYESMLKRRIAQEVEIALSSPDVRAAIDQGLLEVLGRLLEARPPVGRYITARAEGDDFVVRYVKGARH